MEKIKNKTVSLYDFLCTNEGNIKWCVPIKETKKGNIESKIIHYEFIAYVGSVFTDENGLYIEFDDIKDNLYELTGKKGKIIHQGTEYHTEQGFSGSYENYGFVYQDNLRVKKLNGKTSFKKV